MSAVLPYSSVRPSARPFREQFALFSTLLRQTSWSDGMLHSSLTSERILALSESEVLESSELCTIFKARVAGPKFKALWPDDYVRVVVWASSAKTPPEGSAPVPVAFLNVDVNWRCVPASMLSLYFLSLLKVTPQDPESYFQECVSAVDAETELECMIAGLRPGTTIGTRGPSDVQIQFAAPAPAEEAAGETLPSRGVVRVDPKTTSALLRRSVPQPIQQSTIILPPSRATVSSSSTDYRPPLFISEIDRPLALPASDHFFLLYSGPEPLAFLRRAVRAATRPRWLHYHLYVSKHFDGARQYLSGAPVDDAVIFIKDIDYFFPRAADEKFIMHGKNVFLGMLERGQMPRVVATCVSRESVDDSILNRWVSDEQR